MATEKHTTLIIVAALALALCVGPALAAQDSSGGQSGEDEMFGGETVTTEAATTTAPPTKSVTTWDQVRVGGNLAGRLSWNTSWKDPWNAGIDLANPATNAVSPSIRSALTITAKPSQDFGANLELRMGNPFASSTTVLSNAIYVPAIVNPVTKATISDPTVKTVSTSVPLPDINVFSLYSKFSWNDLVFMSFGKQSLAWGVSRSFFQPADDIFALSAVDNADTSAQREGPIAFKAQVPVPLGLSNLYFYTGMLDTASVDPKDLRVAAKAETSFLNNEVALAGYYAYNDHPRALLMGTTGNGDINLFGEAVAKWGSERYFLSKDGAGTVTGAQADDRWWLTAVAGGYYTNSDWNLTLSASYLYNGEGQSGISAKEAYSYYMLHQGQADRMRFGTHYIGGSLQWSKVLVDNLSLGAYGLADLSDQSWLAVPSITWKFFDYMSLALSATLAGGADGSEFPTQSSFGSIGTADFGKPVASFSATVSLGGGSF